MLVDDEDFPILSTLEHLSGAAKRHLDLHSSSVRQYADDREVEAVTGRGQVRTQQLYSNGAELCAD